MRGNSAALLLGLAVLVSAFSGVNPGLAQTAPAQETAIYKVGAMDADLTRNLAMSLVEIPGMVSAEPNQEDGTFLVTFKTSETNPEKILEKLKTVAPGVTLSGVKGAAGEEPKKHDCNTCPYRNQCGGAH